MLPRVSSLIVCVGLFAGISDAGVIVVDAQNGPGTDFVELKPALAAAANGDVVLLRSGTYDGFHVISGKAVSVVADAGANVVITNTDPASFVTSALQLVGSIPGTVLIQGCSIQSTFLTPSTPAEGALRVATTGPLGNVFVENCSAHAGVGNGIDIVGFCRATVSQCVGVGGDATVVLPGFFAAGAGLWAASPASASMTSVYSSDFTGGNGIDQLGPLPGPSVLAGGAGIRVSTLNSVRNKLVAGTSARGGTGGDTTLGPPNCVAPGAGGHGIETIAGFGPYFVDDSAAGGAAGTDLSTCGLMANNGQPIAVTFLGLPGIDLPSSPARVVSHPPVRENDAVTLTIEGTPNHATFVVIGYSLTHVIAPQMSGSLIANPDAIVALGSLPPSGALTLSTHAPSMPVGVDAGIVYLQPITQDMTTGQATLGAPAALVILDASL